MYQCFCIFEIQKSFFCRVKSYFVKLFHLYIASIGYSIVFQWSVSQFIFNKCRVSDLTCQVCKELLLVTLCVKSEVVCVKAFPFSLKCTTYGVLSKLTEPIPLLNGDYNENIFKDFYCRHIYNSYVFVFMDKTNQV